MSKLNLGNLDQTSETNKKNEAHLNLKKISKKVEGSNFYKISDLIGQGDDAKNAIVWTIVRWSLIIPAAITFLYFCTMWAVYGADLDYKEQVLQIREHILKIWGVFAPLITLALGYIFGKNAGNQP